MTAAMRPTGAGATTEADASRPGRGYRGYVLGILLVVYCSNFVDRQIIAVLSPQLKAELHLSDTQLGLLKGLAFALFYAFMAIPLAILSDRWHRVKLISIALALWSTMTAISGFAQTFLQLLISRFMVGIGEAGGNPPSHALLSDYFARDERATALGIYQLGVPLGTLFGFLVGGWLAANYGWRATFFALGIPGVVLAVIVRLTIREIPRGASERGMAAHASAPGWLAEIAELWRIPSYRLVTVSGGLNAFCGYALSMWLIDLFVRLHHYRPQSAAAVVALIIGIGGGIGTYFGGFVTDRRAVRDIRSHFDVPGTAQLLCAPLLLTALWATPSAAIVLLGLVFALLYSTLGPLYGLVQTLSPVRSRALSVATFSLSLSVVGAGFGPFVVGTLSDMIGRNAGNGGSLRLALCVLPVLAAAAGLVLLLGRSRIERDFTRPVQL